MANEDRAAKYGPMPEEEKKSVTVAFRLTEADAAALLGTSGSSEASVHEIARMAALERIDNFAGKRERKTA